MENKCKSKLIFTFTHLKYTLHLYYNIKIFKLVFDTFITQYKM
nr:MAG TPA: hypothetical protein [Caudoviricetes sp.]